MVNHIKRESTMTCPECGHRKSEMMPEDACEWFINANRAGHFSDQEPEIAVCFSATVTCHVHRFSKVMAVVERMCLHSSQQALQ